MPNEAIPRTEPLWNLMNRLQRAKRGDVSIAEMVELCGQAQTSLERFHDVLKQEREQHAELRARMSVISDATTNWTKRFAKEGQ